MELLQLRYFMESAKTENFARTAEKYIIPSSTVSMTIKRLEKELGCELFNHYGNKVTLNENGRKLQRTVGPLLDELDKVALELSAPAEKNVELRILIKVLRSKISDAIIDYQKNHAGIVFRPTFDFVHSDDSDYDMIIDVQNDRYADYEKIEICNRRIRLIASTDHPACGKPLTLKQLHSYPFIIMSKNSTSYKKLLNACKNAGFVPNVIMEVNDTSCYKKFIQNGVGIGLMREGALQPNDKISVLSVGDFNQWQTYCGYYKSSLNGPAIWDFIDYLTKINI